MQTARRRIAGVVRARIVVVAAEGISGLAGATFALVSLAADGVVVTGRPVCLARVHAASGRVARIDRARIRVVAHDVLARLARAGQAELDTVASVAVRARRAVRERLERATTRQGVA
jgi:hypothetical protein